MQQITILTDDADQLVTVVAGDGSLAQMEFFYRPGIQRWSVDITHTGLPGGVIHGLNLCLGPNILRQWRNLIPFGMALTSLNGLDPMQSTDFLNGTVTVNILSAAEVSLVEKQILAAIPLVNP